MLQESHRPQSHCSPTWHSRSCTLGYLPVIRGDSRLHPSERAHSSLQILTNFPSLSYRLVLISTSSLEYVPLLGTHSTIKHRSTDHKTLTQPHISAHKQIIGPVLGVHRVLHLHLCILSHRIFWIYAVRWNAHHMCTSPLEPFAAPSFSAPKNLAFLAPLFILTHLLPVIHVQFILFLIMKCLQTLWEVGLVFLYDMFLVDHILSLASFLSSFLVLAMTVWLAVVLHAYGPPPEEDLAFSSFVI